MKHRSKSSLFLIELIVVILFFALSSTVCIQLFVKAHLLGNKTEDLNICVQQAQNYAEVFTGFNGSVTNFCSFYEDSLMPVTESDNNSVIPDYIVYYDSNGESVKSSANIAKEDTEYNCLLSFRNPSSNMSLLSISFYKTSTEVLVYQLDVEQYLGIGGVTHE